jgi:RNA polymerase sigma-70 factor (ECF subfamily)
MKRIPEEAIEAARTGGAADIERLMEAAWLDAYRLAFSVIGNADAAQDAAQEACVTMYRAIGSLRSSAAFRVWLYRIVVRAAMDVQRRSAPPVPERTIATDDPEQTIDIWRALNALPPKLRAVVVLRYFEGLNSREIASVLRVPDGTVRFRLASAMRGLRPLLSDSEERFPKAGEVRTHAI